MNKKIESIGLGTAAIGRPHYINLRHETPTADTSLSEFRSSGIKILEDAYNKGVRFFDASPGYGLIESLLVEWLQQKSDPEITIATKWGLSYLANFDKNAKVHEFKEHSFKKLNSQWEFSKKLLPYLKIYQIHSATLETGVLNNQNILRRLHDIKKEYNLVIGLTTTGANQVEVLDKALGIEIENEPLFNSFQCTYNIMEQSIIPFKAVFQSRDRQLIIKESLANGRLIPNSDFVKHKSLYRQMTSLSAKYNVTTDALAMRFCMDSFPESICLSGASSTEQLHSNLTAKTFKLQQDDLQLLSSYYVDSTDYWDERKQLPWQ
ncbi:aldo/keto reductase [Sphingobacterium sp. NPDC055346]